MPKAKEPNTLLGFDFGMRQIGVAIGQAITKTATPLTILKAEDGVPNWDLIAEMIVTWAVEAFVVGIPYKMDGSEQAITLAARSFGRKLHGRFHLPVFFMDERLTSKEAKNIAQLAYSDKTRIDSIAAQLILESWLRENG